MVNLEPGLEMKSPAEIISRGYNATALNCQKCQEEYMGIHRLPPCADYAREGGILLENLFSKCFFLTVWIVIIRQWWAGAVLEQIHGNKGKFRR